MDYLNIKKFFERALIIVTCTLILIPNTAYGTIINTVNEYKQNKIIKEDNRIIAEYVNIDSDDSLYFDIDRAKQNKESADIIKIGELFNDYSYKMNHSQDFGENVLRGIPIWGNWCGPGYGSGPPIDLLDEGCKRHDHCYVQGGNNCSCNRNLINYINNNFHRMTSGQQLMARAVRGYFKAENARNGC